MRRLIKGREQDVPALAVAARAAGECHRECQVERRDLPLVAGEGPFHVDAIWLQQNGRRGVFAMLVLHAGGNPQLAPRTPVYFELLDAVDDVIVKAFGVAAVGLPARLPVAFEDVLGTLRVRRELREERRSGEKHARGWERLSQHLARISSRFQRLTRN